jgi:hypothetical protein
MTADGPPTDAADPVGAAAHTAGASDIAAAKGSPVGGRARAGDGWGGGSGPDVARLFHRALALVFLVAWISLGAQVRVLIGSRGLLPFAHFLAAARAAHVLSVLDFPSVLALFPGDGALVAGTVVGAALAILALAGVGPRACVAAQTILYLGYVTACRSFLSFQWDNLLLECGLLATFLPTRRAAPVAHFLLRALLFKLYFESGIAKWQSPLHDWQDGSAMTFYYETAPLPTALGWYAHHLPRWWHLFESRATLVLELAVPFAIFGPRRARLLAAAAFTLFQTMNVATANYGFFCYLAFILHLFLLDDRDVAGVRRRVAHIARVVGASRIGRALPWSRRSPNGTNETHEEDGSNTANETNEADEPSETNETNATNATTTNAPAAAGGGLRFHRRLRLRRAAAGLGLCAWLVTSSVEAYFHFGDPGDAARPLVAVLELSQTYRLVSAYHLFAAVTRQRIEPEIQVQVDGGAFVPLVFKYKPGPLGRAPPLVAPHQPRIDFLLWFYGLSFQQRRPAYVAALLDRLCDDPAAVAALFTVPPPAKTDAVRIVFWDYRFTSPDQRRATRDWWTRRQLQSTIPLPCAR